MQADVLIIQDLSCVGQVSMSVALPLLAAAELETRCFTDRTLINTYGGLW